MNGPNSQAKEKCTDLANADALKGWPGKVGGVLGSSRKRFAAELWRKSSCGHCGSVARKELPISFDEESTALRRFVKACRS